MGPVIESGQLVGVPVDGDHGHWPVHGSTLSTTPLATMSGSRLLWAPQQGSYGAYSESWTASTEQLASGFDEAGRHLPGACRWKARSKAAKRTGVLISEAYRVMTARRSSDHGHLANELVTLSPHVRAEDHGVKAWQRGLFSKQVQRRAPGSQLARIGAAAKRASGELTDVSPRLGLSQLCTEGERKKKPLSERRHRCKEHGLDLDRDLFPAFLERHVVFGSAGQVVSVPGAPGPRENGVRVSFGTASRA
ncbi:MAG: hypothetical protein ACP5VR_06985, partial [Acidimicrobiales bacterium]